VSALAEALATGTLDGPVVVVLEGAARAGVPEGPVGTGLRVVHAPTDGDSAIVAEVSDLVAAGAEPTVVTADRGLRARVEAAGGNVVGPSWLRDRLP
jgi:hypothetical protein